MQIKHVLMTSDLSEESLHPFGGVLGLAREAGADVTLLAVVEDVKIAPHGAPFAPMLSDPNLGKEVEHAREVLEQQKSLFGEDQNIKVDVISAQNVAEGIVAYAETHNVDLIAISTHGRSGFRHLALGSVAEAVLRTSPIPVLSFRRIKK